MQALTALGVPQPPPVVGAASDGGEAIEGPADGDDLTLMASEGGEMVASSGPDAGSGVEGGGDEPVAEGEVELEGVDDVTVAGEGVEGGGGGGGEEFAGTVVGAGDEVGTVLVEGAVGQREEMGVEGAVEGVGGGGLRDAGLGDESWTGEGRG